MTLRATLFALFVISFFNLFAQIPPNISQIRQQIRQFEKERFMNQQQRLQKVLTPNQNDYDVQVYRLKFDIYPTTQLLIGDVTISGFSRVNGLDHLEEDLYDNMTVDSVLQNGTPLAFTHSNDLINITLPTPINQNDPFAVEIFYQGNPQSGGLGTWGWDYHQGTPIIWTLSEPYGAPAWWPCKDSPVDKADSVFLQATVPNNLVVASNGLLTNVIPAGNNRDTYFWETHYPISTYLVSLAITNYAHFTDTYTSPLSGDTMSLSFYVYPEHLAAAQEDFNVTASMIAAYATRFGEYPFMNEKYGMAIFPWGGAMEHQTMTSYGAGLITGNHIFDWIIAHELSHQWFGDMITMRSWHHIWLNEGFASYAEALWAEETGGSTGYHNYMASQDPGYFSGTVFVQDTTNMNELFSNTVYDKGSWVLHMLRGVLGDSLFFASLKSYASDPNFAYGNAVTEDFRDVCERVSGMDLDWFFNQWVYNGGRPFYLYSWTTTSSPPYQTFLNIQQQNNFPFKMPLQIRLTGLGLDTTFTVWDSLFTQQFAFITDTPPTDLQVDPDDWVLKHLTEGQVYTVDGTVIDLADSSGMAFAGVYWEGPYDTTTGFPLGSGIVTTGQSGDFQLSLIPGDYAIRASKIGYLSSPFHFIHVENNVSGMILSLSQPAADVTVDSLAISLLDNQTFDTTVTVANLGSGAMLIQAVEGNTGAGASAVARGNVLKQQIPLSRLKKATPATTPTVVPIDSLWQHLHHDARENPANPYDLNNTYIQQNNNLLYFKFTTYDVLTSFNNLRFNIFLDTDNNPFTGLPVFDIGTDYLIAVGDFGAGYFGYLLVWNPAGGTFDFVAPVDYFLPEPQQQSLTVGINSSLINQPEFLALMVNAFQISDLVNTIDYIPSSNLGHLTAALTGISWLDIHPLFDIADADSDGLFLLSIAPGNMPPGIYQSAITFYTSHANGMQAIHLPIRLDHVTGIADKPHSIPNTFEVSQNYPNPFNPETQIRYGLPKPARVTIEIFNILGQRVYIHKTPLLSAGYHTFTWKGISTNGQSLSSGVYFYKVSDGKQAIIRKMVLIR